MPIKILKYRNKNYAIYRSHRRNKKYKVMVKGKWIHFGARGYKIKTGTIAGNSYCSRSYAIKNRNNMMSANFWSRLMWRCHNKQSI